MTIRKSLLAFAVASLCATSAHALFVDFGDEDGPVGGGYNGGSGGVTLPPVTITGTRRISIEVPGWYGYYGDTPTRIARPPSGDEGAPSQGVAARGTPATPDEKRKRYEQCQQDCSVSFQIANNNCMQMVSALRYDLAAGPYWAAMATGFIGYVMTRKPNGIVAGLPIGWTYATQVIDRQIADQEKSCAAAAGQDWNHCVTSICEAWFLPLLLVGARRRKEDETAS